MKKLAMLLAIAAAFAAPMATAQTKEQQCQLLDKKIKELDEYSRKALPASEQERVRKERREAHDERFRLGCMKR